MTKPRPPGQGGPSGHFPYVFLLGLDQIHLQHSQHIFFFFFFFKYRFSKVERGNPVLPLATPAPHSHAKTQRGGRDRLPGQRETTQQHHRLPCALPEGTTRPENRPQACHTVTWILKCYLSKKIKRSFLSCCPGTKVKQTHEGWSNQNQLPRHARPRFSTRANAH